MQPVSPSYAADRPIVATLWPRADGFGGVVRAVVLIGAGVLLLAASAKFNLPLPYVPMTLQTLVVLLVGAVYGWRLGLATVIAYLASGALGVPVFAGAVGGLNPMLGPTAGFLFGFVVAVLVTGLGARGRQRSFIRIFAVMAVAHVVILACGFAWLAYGVGLGPAKAWGIGIAPFVAGAVVKNAAGAALVMVFRRWADRR